uniref:Uncharacterized protein n=1 Tax=Candidatus Kentrum sp. FM TaxID=2126340 RepID=A0A450S5W2_9GAMM|nr:MAG: hypothetical protein BECKFM1743A_GA0114220_1004513 [Candidatus Kentron sp. FM]VFJ48615.1 MAG: hypothetical protein BECKFM1743C_GA0114222_1006112 [Candidatus Kentron sp. FM]VFK08066.1 MAG: hypothetical protein BECKFM1743B_GA0114221_1005811 [Candidatus Kentron sp. FM]
MNRKRTTLLLFALLVFLRPGVAAGDSHAADELPGWLTDRETPATTGAQLPPMAGRQSMTMEEEIAYLEAFIRDVEAFVGQLAAFTEKQRAFYESVMEVKALCQVDRELANAQGEFGAIFQMGLEDCEITYADLQAAATELATRIEAANAKQKRLQLAAQSAHDSVLRKKSILRARTLQQETEKANQLLLKLERKLEQYK